MYVICESPSIYQCFKMEGTFYCEQLVIRGYTGGNKKTTAVDISALRAKHAA